MAFSAKILADSISMAGKRLVTVEATYPRIIHAELMTHRMFSRNAASSRAIPSKKLRASVWNNPFIPAYWGKNQSGMQAEQELQGWRRWAAIKVWFLASRLAVFVSWLLDTIGVHKQLANRVLEPFQWYTVIISATEWSNFFALRDHPDAQPEIQALARAIKQAVAASEPRILQPGEWHLPLVTNNDELRLLTEGYTTEDLKHISVGRCARVSYLTHDGKRDPKKDIELCCDTLIARGHMSPTEHVATPVDDPNEAYGNFRGWRQYRQEIPNEADFGARSA